MAFAELMEKYRVCGNAAAHPENSLPAIQDRF
jgi:hypothetical protein